MFSREQIDVLYLLAEKGIVTVDTVNAFLKGKLAEIGVKDPEPEAPVAPEVPAEPVPPAPETPAA